MRRVLDAQDIGGEVAFLVDEDAQAQRLAGIRLDIRAP